MTPYASKKADAMAVAGREWVGLVFFHSTIGVTKKFGK
ncbi:hypothetical protein AAZX31_01G083500 [Glycine max]